MSRSVSDLKEDVLHLDKAEQSRTVIIEQVAASEELVQGEAQEQATPYVYGLSAVAAVSGLCFGYDTGVISAALVNIRQDLGHTLNDSEKEWISSGTSCGALVGALLGGTGADRIGRKWILAIGDFFFIIGATIIASSYSFTQIVVGRVILGFGVGIASAVAPVYIAELSPTRFRATLVTIQSLCITGGQFISYVLGIPLTIDGGWRILFAIGILPALGQGLAVHFLPESPRYDLMRGQTDAARQTLHKVYKHATDQYIELKMQALQEGVKISAQFQEKYPLPQRLALVAKTGHLRRAAITATVLGIFQQWCGFNTLMYYSATIFTMAGFNNPTAVGLIVSGANFFFTIIAFFVLDYIGKRTILLYSYPGMIAGLALAAFAFAKMTIGTGGKLIEGVEYPKNWSNMILGMMVLFIASYATGLGNIPWQSVEMFPLELRGLGSSMLAGGVWTANIVVAATFLTIMNLIGAAGAFGLYASICLLGFLFVLFCYPEVAGLSLEDVQVIFHYGFGIKKSKELRRRQKTLDGGKGNVRGRHP